MKRQRGFTVIEILIAIIFLAFAGTLFYVQKRGLEVASRDNDRKVAINAMYYNLEEVYYPAHSSYPKAISAANLKAMDPELFKDPNSVAVGDQTSNYRYEPSGCVVDVCQSYSLRTILEAEADFIKTARH